MRFDAMLEQLGRRLTRASLKSLSRLVPRWSEEMVRGQVIDQDRKNDGLDLEGWTYERVTSPRSGTLHRYYAYPSPHDGAPTLIFLHGLNLDGRNFLPYSALADRFELIAYDFPESSPRYHGSIDDVVDLLDDFIDTLGIDSFALAGVSFGGMVALRWAGRLEPSRLLALALISTAIPGTSRKARRRAALMHDVLDALEDPQILWLVQLFVAIHLARLPDARARAAVRSLLRPKDPAWHRQVASSVDGYVGTGDASRIRCPTLVILGGEDRLIPVESREDFHRYVPHAKVVVLDGARHAVSFTRPDLILEPLRELLDEGAAAREKAPRSR